LNAGPKPAETVIGTGVGEDVTGEAGIVSRGKAGDPAMEGSDMDPVRPAKGLRESREPTLLTDLVGEGEVEGEDEMATVANHNQGMANDVILGN